MGIQLSGYLKKIKLICPNIGKNVGAIMYLSPENLRKIYPKVIYTTCENSFFVDLKNATINQNKIDGVNLYDNQIGRFF